MADAALHPSSRPPLTQRQKLALVSSGGLLVALVVVLVFLVYPWARWTEDFFPGSPPDENPDVECMGRLR
jgi:hypothetical protein